MIIDYYSGELERNADPAGGKSSEQGCWDSSVEVDLDYRFFLEDFRIYAHT